MADSFKEESGAGDLYTVNSYRSSLENRCDAVTVGGGLIRLTGACHLPKSGLSVAPSSAQQRARGTARHREFRPGFSNSKASHTESP